MKLTIQKKDIRILPNSRIRIDVVSMDSAVVTEGNDLDRARYLIPCQAEKVGDVYLKDADILEMFKANDICIQNTTRAITISDNTGLSFKQPCITNEDVAFPEYSGVGIKTTAGSLRKAFKGICATICGCYLRYDGLSCEMVTTDRSQIARTLIPIIGPEQPPFSVVISETSVKNISGFMEKMEENTELEIINTSSPLILKNEEWEYATPCLNVTFPGYDAMVGSLKKVSSFITETDTFLHALECSMLMSDYVRFEPGDGGTYLAADGENGSFGPFLVSKDQIHLKKILCSAKKLGKGVRRFSDISGQKEVSIYLQDDDKSPLFLESSNHLFALAPMIG